MKNKRKSGEFPVTGVLIGVVAVLAVCACILAVLLWSRQSRDAQSQEKSGSQTIESGQLSGRGDKSEDINEDGTDAGAAAEPESSRDIDPESEIESESGPEPESDTETEADTEAESKTETESETETGSETETEEVPEEKLTVAIDPGHQGSWVDMSATEPNGPGSSEMKTKSTTGTQGSYSGVAEYELNLNISLLLRTELESRGYQVILTREDNDTAISNAERARMAYEQGGDIYVRIHANGSDDPSVNGALAMVPSSDNPYVGYLAESSRLLGESILNAYCARAGFQSLGIQYYDNMTGINWSQVPVMILEMGFMTNESDDLRMEDAQIQTLMAEGIADGIDDYFEAAGLKEKEVPAEAKERINALLEQIQEEQTGPAQAQGEEWAVSLKDLETGASGTLSGDIPMKSASIIKVFIMAAVYDRICYPSSEERHISFPESYDGELKELLTNMITVSDNTAANRLIEALGYGDAAAGMAVVNQFCEENGYTATSLGREFLETDPSGDNYTSANDCLALLESIYTGNCVCAEASEKMFAYLLQQTRTSKIPAGVPDTAVTANKTGELYGEYGDYVENDIAVVQENGKAYILCVMSQKLRDDAQALARVTEISRLCYETCMM